MEITNNKAPRFCISPGSIFSHEIQIEIISPPTTWCTKGVTRLNARIILLNEDWIKINPLCHASYLLYVSPSGLLVGEMFHLVFLHSRPGLGPAEIWETKQVVISPLLSPTNPSQCNPSAEKSVGEMITMVWSILKTSLVEILVSQRTMIRKIISIIRNPTLSTVHSQSKVSFEN